MIRVTLTGDLEGFNSLGFDDHIKLFFPDGTLERRRRPQHAQPRFHAAPPRRRREHSEIDFALHDAGPATRWAAQAKPGDALNVGGPRGSFIIPTDFDWHLLIGDETALPAISDGSPNCRPNARVLVVGEIDGPADQVALATKADATVIWAHRNGAAAGESDVLAKKLATLEIPFGRLLCVGCLRVAHRQGAASAIDRRSRRQPKMDARRRLLAPRRRRHP